MPPDRPPDDDEAEDEEARAFVLARRAKFVAGALASAGLASSACDGPGPFACLEPPVPATAVAPPVPTVCLSPMAPPRPADAGHATATGGQPSTGPSDEESKREVLPQGSKPVVCLSFPPPKGKPPRSSDHAHHDPLDPDPDKDRR